MSLERSFSFITPTQQQLFLKRLRRSA
jgi:hypothetical protein